MTDENDGRATGEAGTLDLEAWEVPAPPAGIADAVVARMQLPPGASALDAPPPRRISRRWIAGSAFVVAAAGGATAVALWPSDEVHAVPTTGFVAAAKPSHVDLGASAVELDAQSEISWTRDGQRVVAGQPRGRAMWKIAAEDTLVIDAGATVASVEATGASLRVEVHMNHTDVRVIGASALTAATVALVTIVVYEGHVKVSSAGHTVNVQPGTTVEVKPGEEPRVPVDELVGIEKLERMEVERQDLLVALEKRDRQMAEEERKIAQGKRELAEKKRQIDALEDAVGKLGVDEIEVPIRDGSLDRDEIQQAIVGLGYKLTACGGGYNGKVTITVTVDPEGRVGPIAVSPAVSFGDCIKTAITALQFPRAPNTTRFTYPLVFSTAKCDFDKLVKDADEAAARGSHTLAMTRYEDALKCRYDATAYNKAFLAACNARDRVAATRLYPALPAKRLKQRCVMYGMDPADFDSSATPASGPDSIGRDDITKAIASVKGELAACDDGSHQGTVKAKVKVAPSGSVDSVKMDPVNGVSDCMRRVLEKLTFRATKGGGSFSYPWVVGRSGTPPPNQTCNGADCAKNGTLHVTSTPWSRIWVDGLDTGQHTPTKLELAPGRHKITLQVGGDKFTYTVKVEAGKVTTLAKDLQ